MLNQSLNDSLLFNPSVLISLNLNSAKTFPDIYNILSKIELN